MVAAHILSREAELERNARKRDHAARAAARKARGLSYAFLRVADLEQVLVENYRGHDLPNDDAGYGDLCVVLHHLAMTGPGNTRRMLAWTRDWAPWMDEAKARKLVHCIAAHPHKWRADTLARMLNVTLTQRTRLGLSTIGAVGYDRTQLREIARQVKRKRRRLARRAKGAKSQRKSLSRLKPWDSEGMSRATWYRRKRETVLTRA